MVRMGIGSRVLLGALVGAVLVGVVWVGARRPDTGVTDAGTPVPTAGMVTTDAAADVWSVDAAPSTSSTLPVASTAASASVSVTTTTTVRESAAAAPLVETGSSTTSSEVVASTTTEAATTTEPAAVPATTAVATEPGTGPATTVITSVAAAVSAPTTVPVAVSVSLAVAAEGEDCAGSYRADGLRVRDQCILDVAQDEFTKFFTGTHATRMTAIRDGHVLADVWAGLQAWIAEQVGEEVVLDPTRAESWASDFDASGHRRIDVCCAEWRSPNLIFVRYRYRAGNIDQWEAGPMARVDGQWKIDYTGFCRMVTNFDIGVTCPPDPRPGVVIARHGDMTGSGYDPIDDPGRSTGGW